MKLTPYWLDTAPVFTGAQKDPPSGRFDVAVIGGGFTGLSAALTLAKKGVSVAILEAGRVSGEASGRNGGHCNNGLSHDYSGIRDRFGPERAKEMYRAFDQGVDTVERIVREEAIDCDFVRRGKLKLAVKPEHAKKLAKTQEILARDVDPETEFLSALDLKREIGADVYHGALLMKKSGSLHVGRFAVGLATAAARAGARIFENAAVTALERGGSGRFTVTSGAGTIEANNVLIATGASREGPFGWIRRRIVPVGSFIVVTEPLAKDIAQAILPGRRNCVTSAYIGNYFRLTADDRLVFGGRARFALSGPKSDPKSGKILERGLRALFPILERTRIDYCWGGLVDMTSDRLPRAGEREGAHFAVGFSGHGVQMSTLMGNIMARKIAGEDVPNPWRDLEWPPIPGYFGTPWFLPAVGAYYRIKDRVE